MSTQQSFSHLSTRGVNSHSLHTGCINCFTSLLTWYALSMPIRTLSSLAFIQHLKHMLEISQSIASMLLQTWRTFDAWTYACLMLDRICRPGDWKKITLIQYTAAYCTFFWPCRTTSFWNMLTNALYLLLFYDIFPSFLCSDDHFSCVSSAPLLHPPCTNVLLFDYERIAFLCALQISALLLYPLLAHASSKHWCFAHSKKQSKPTLQHFHHASTRWLALRFCQIKKYNPYYGWRGHAYYLRTWNFHQNELQFCLNTWHAFDHPRAFTSFGYRSSLPFDCYCFD